MLTDTQKEVLSLGPKFCDRPKSFNKINTKLQFENLIHQISDLTPSSDIELEHFRSTVYDWCQQFECSIPKGNRLLTKKHIEELRILQKNKDLIMTRPDKGSGIVLLNKEEYISKMNKILCDEKKFSHDPKDKDKTAVIEKQLTKILKQMLDDSIIDKDLYDKLRPTGSTIPRLYGVPKVHKDGVPLRPILDMNNSPHHAIAKWLNSILDPIRKSLSIYSVKDTFEFIECIKNINVKRKSMLSLDVTSLFTNVPLNETILFLCNHIDNNHIDLGIPTQYIRELLLRCTFNVQFRFNNLMYR